MIRRRSWPRVHLSLLLFSCSVLLLSFPALVSSAMVTLDSIEIFKMHDLIPWDGTIFFRCKGENDTVLPDVKQKHVLYLFKGVESWQPLTELQDVKCKRCGIYEKTVIRSEDVFDEWEFCPSDFTGSDGRYLRFKDKEFNATFLCPQCVPLASGAKGNSSSQPDNSSDWDDDSEEIPWILVGVVVIITSGMFVCGLVASCRWWQQRKRKQQQARFLKMFEEADDDFEDELGIGPLSHTI